MTTTQATGYSLSPFAGFWKEALVERKNSHILHREIIDLRTKKRYWCEPRAVISIKCCTIFFVIIPFFLGHVAWYLSKSFVASLYLMKKPVKVLKNIVYCIQQIARAAFYTLAIQMTALFLGVLAPFEARKIISNFECEWHQKSYYGYDIRRKLPEETSFAFFLLSLFFDFKLLYLYLTDQKEPQVFYLAPCFRSLGNIQDKDIILI